VWLADLGRTTGSEQGGVRPVLVIQNAAGNRHSPTVIVAAVTGRRKKHLPTHAILGKDGHRLRRDSTILMEQVRTVDRVRLMKYLGRLDSMEMARADAALTVSVGLLHNPEIEEGAFDMDENRTWIYTRIDAPEDTSGALKGQEKELLDYVERLGLTVVGWSSDIGGADTDKPGLARLSEAAETKDFSILLIRSLSRIGRDGSATIDFLIQLNRLGIETYSLLEGKIDVFQLTQQLSGQPSGVKPEMEGAAHA
jgi:mRNA interferase MazF